MQNIVNKKGLTGLAVGPLLFAGILFISPIFIAEELPFNSRVVIATAAWLSVWWITEAIPIYITALLPLIIFPYFNIISLQGTSALYADRIVFLFLGGFILAKAIEKTNLHRRFALNILNIFGTNPKHIVAAFMIVTGFLSGWISNTATTMLIVPIAAAVISQTQSNVNSYGNNNNNLKIGRNNSNQYHESKNNFSVCLLLSVAYSASIGGMSTLIGTPPNAIFASLSESLLGREISFGSWMIMAAPISAITLLVAWFYLVNFGAKIRNIPIAGERGIIADNLKKLGKMSLEEKIVAVVFGATAIAWISRGLLWKDLVPGVDDSAIALISAISLFIISYALKYTMAGRNKLSNNGVDYNNNNEKRIKIDDKEQEPIQTAKPTTIIDWNTAVRIPWGVLLLIGGGLALAGGFTETGLDKYIADQLSFLDGLSYFLIIVIMLAVTVFAGEIISNTATAALLIPIAASLAVSLSINPIMLMAPIAIATSIGFIMPVATPPNAIVFSTGHITAAKMARAGLPLDIIGILIVTLLSSVLVPSILR